MHAPPLTDVAGSRVSLGARLALLDDVGHATVRGQADLRAAVASALAALSQAARLAVRGLDTGNVISAGAHIWWLIRAGGGP